MDFVTLASADVPRFVLNFIPLKLAGLWLAVTIMPPTVDLLLAARLNAGVGINSFENYFYTVSSDNFGN